MKNNVIATHRARALNNVGHEDIVKKKQIVINILPYMKQGGQEAWLRTPEPEPAWMEAAPGQPKPGEVTTTVPEHYIAGRIDIAQYFDYGHRYGWFSMFTLHRVGEKWAA